MANELVIHYPTGATLYALLFDATGQVYNGSAFAAPGSAAWTDYDIAMTEVATATGVYRASMPAAAAGVYGWVVRKQAGGSPAVGDIAVGAGSIRWTGTAEEAVPAAVNVTMQQGVAVAAADVSGYINVLNVLGNVDGTVGEVTNLSLTAQQAIRDAMKLAPSAGAPAAGSVDAHLDAVALEATAQAVLTAVNAIEPGGGSYAGDGTGYYTDTIDDGTNPLDGVRVQLYTAQNRVGPAYEAYTNALGVFEMWPDPGTYYRWLDYAGVSFAQDVAVVVTEP